MSFYTESQRLIQAQFESSKLAERVEAAIVKDEIVPELHQEFIESRDFFFLSTVNNNGEPTVTHKGGPVGVVTVVDSKTLAFPSYDGNGMFLSIGNIAETGKIGMLFSDFETPNRIRVQATAEFSTHDPLMATYPRAQLIVRAKVSKVFMNCSRLIHKHTRVSRSPYVPKENGKHLFRRGSGSIWSKTHCRRKTLAEQKMKAVLLHRKSTEQSSPPVNRDRTSHCAQVRPSFSGVDLDRRIHCRLFQSLLQECG